MTAGSRVNGTRGPATRVCLTGTAAELAPLVAGARALDGRIAALIVAPGAGPDTAAIEELREIADDHDLAFLVAEDAGLAADVGADGAEIDWSRDGYAAAREALGPERSIGCRAGLSRDLAMEAAEAGADYVALLAPGAAGTDIAVLVEMVAWWSEIVEVPCLARGARDVGDIARLAAAGADFVAVGAALYAADGQGVLAAIAGAAP